jgi:carbon starvation protein
LVVAAWGWFLIQGVRDPLGGINSLWPLFGIANQMLAAIALCLAVTIILKMQLKPSENSWDRRRPAGETSPEPTAKYKTGKPALALVALAPLLWLLAVTMTAGAQKIWHPSPKIGFLAQASVLKSKIPDLESAIATARTVGDASAIAAAEKALQTNRILIFNNQLDAVVAGTFLFLVSAIFLMSVREWILLLARKKVADLHETPPTWLPDYMLAASKPLSAMALLALAFALVKELSGEADLDRAREHTCACSQKQEAVQIYVQTTEQRFNGVKRCC